MVPAEIAIDIKSRFPDVKLLSHRSMFNSGFGVEITIDGKVERNGWVVDKDTDWQDIKHKALTWLTARSRF